MTEENKIDINEFKEYCRNMLNAIYSKLNDKEAQWLSDLVTDFNSTCERNFKAIDLYLETLNKQNNTNTPMPDVAVKMFNLLEGNVK